MIFRAKTIVQTSKTRHFWTSSLLLSRRSNQVGMSRRTNFYRRLIYNDSDHSKLSLIVHLRCSRLWGMTQSQRLLFSKLSKKKISTKSSKKSKSWSSGRKAQRVWPRTGFFAITRAIRKSSRTTSKSLSSWFMTRGPSSWLMIICGWRKDRYVCKCTSLTTVLVKRLAMLSNSWSI